MLVGIGFGFGSASSRRRCSSKLLDEEQDRESPDLRSFQEAAEGDPALGLSADVRASAVLYLHRFRLRLRGRHAAHVARPRAVRGPGGRRAPSLPSRCPATSPTASGAGNVSDRRGRDRTFWFLYFGMLDTAMPWAVFIAIVLSLIPHDMQYGPQAALIAEAFTPRCATVARRLAISSRRSSLAGRRRLSRPRCSLLITPVTRSPFLSPPAPSSARSPLPSCPTIPAKIFRWNTMRSDTGCG